MGGLGRECRIPEAGRMSFAEFEWGTSSRCDMFAESYVLKVSAEIDSDEEEDTPSYCIC